MQNTASGEMALQENGNNELVTSTGDKSCSRNWLSWSSASSSMLRAAEKKILSYLKTSYRSRFVDIGSVVGTADKIWTISLNENSNKTPILLLHGFGSGVALWCLNLDALASTRPVYAIDILGFGSSSRPTFNSDSLLAEKQLVQSVEAWRKVMNLEELIILGHSMGGYLATSYALEHPERVKHLILADPWGFPEKPADVDEGRNIPLRARVLLFLLQPFYPLSAVRAAGPFGQRLIQRMRPDLIKKFTHVVEDEEVIAQYIHQCNAQTPSGEAAFSSMVSGFGWAKNPMLKRIDPLHPDVPISMLFGQESWVDRHSGAVVRGKRVNSYVNVQLIPGVGHHVYADRAGVFNKLVLEACTLTDQQAGRKWLPVEVPEDIWKKKEKEEEEAEVPST